MTDPVVSSYPGYDLAEWLTQVWDEQEKAASTIHAEDCESIPREGYNGPFPCDCGLPAFMLARVEAEKQLLALHVYTVDGSGWVDCTNCGEVGKESAGVTECLHRRLLAQPYSDRPGWQEAWRVTA